MSQKILLVSSLTNVACMGRVTQWGSTSLLESEG